MKISPRIYGFGFHVPEQVVTNNDLSQRVETSDEWIVTRTGIQERRFITAGQTGADLALEATRNTLARSGFDAKNITHIFYATCTADACCPPSACILADKLGLKGIAAFDLNAVCSGFVYGLDLARAVALADPTACVLLVASETLSLRCNWEDRSTCVLFGDGAGAAIVTQTTPPCPPAHSAKAPVIAGSVRDVLLSSDGSLGELLNIGSSFYALGQPVGPEYFIRMQGRDVFKHAVRSMGGICRDLLTRNGLTTADIDVLVPHQANMRIIEAVGSRLAIAKEKVFTNVHKYGNTSAASIPIALGEAIDAGYIRPGKKVLLTTFGGGFTWGAALLEF